MPTRTEMTDDDIAQVERALHDKIQLNLDTRIMLRSRRLEDDCGEEEENEIGVKLQDLTVAADILEKQLMAFESGTASIQPPTDQQINAIESLSASVDSLNRAQAVGSGALGMAQVVLTVAQPLVAPGG